MKGVVVDGFGKFREWACIVVGGETGVFYEAQCGGYEIDLRRIQGFCIPILDPSVGPALGELFGRRARISQDKFVQEIEAILAKIELTACEGLAEWNPIRVWVDIARISELVEAWVPVKTGWGDGVLMFWNID